MNNVWNGADLDLTLKGLRCKFGQTKECLYLEYLLFIKTIKSSLNGIAIPFYIPRTVMSVTSLSIISDCRIEYTETDKVLIAYLAYLSPVVCIDTESHSYICTGQKCAS